MLENRNADGFTLIEVMVALIVLAVGLLAVAQMQLMAVKGNSYGSKMSVASLLAQDALERIAQNAANIANYNNIDTSNSGTRPAGGQEQIDYDALQNSIALSGLTQGRCTIVVTAQPQGNLVTTTVSWSVDGTTRSLSIPTIL